MGGESGPMSRHGVSPIWYFIRSLTAVVAQPVHRVEKEVEE